MTSYLEIITTGLTIVATLLTIVMGYIAIQDFLSRFGYNLHLKAIICSGVPPITTISEIIIQNNKNVPVTISEIYIRYGKNYKFYLYNDLYKNVIQIDPYGYKRIALRLGNYASDGNKNIYSIHSLITTYFNRANFYILTSDGKEVPLKNKLFRFEKTEQAKHVLTGTFGREVFGEKLTNLPDLDE